MSYVVVVWRMSFDGGAVYEDGIFGPFRNEERAEKKAAQIRRAIAREEWDEPGDMPDGVMVRPLNRAGTPARDAIVGHIVPDVGC